MKYELALLVKPLLPEDLKTKVFPSVEALAKKLGGKASLKEDWGKRHLAYPIKGQEEGHYAFFAVELPSDSVTEFNKALRLAQDVLRFLLIKETDL